MQTVSEILFQGASFQKDCDNSNANSASLNVQVNAFQARVNALKD